MKYSLYVALPLLSVSLGAQGLQNWGTALTVLQARASDGITQVIDQRPIGITSFGVVAATANAPTGTAARATANWSTGSTFWQQQQRSEVFFAGGTAGLGPMEMQSSFWNSGQVTQVEYEIVVSSTATTGSTASVSIDVDDDGSFDHIGAGTFVGTRTIGTTALHFRIATSVDSISIGNATTDVRIEVRPAFGIDISNVGGSCGQAGIFAFGILPDYRSEIPFTPQAPSVRLRMVGGVFPMIPVQVIGWGQSLLPIPGLPAGCTLIPTPDILLMQADLTIPLPQAVRPITFYAQGFSFGQTLLAQDLLAHDALRIRAL
ncbi:MAG: hypothetical protein ACI9SE_002993 [Neolewinella sp.]|jgi:hypothetical protein